MEVCDTSLARNLRCKQYLNGTLICLVSRAGPRRENERCVQSSHSTDQEVGEAFNIFTVHLADSACEYFAVSLIDALLLVEDLESATAFFSRPWR